MNLRGRLNYHLVNRLLAVGLLATALILTACGSLSPATTTPPTTTTTEVGPQTVDITGTWRGDWWRSDGREEGTLTATLVQSGGSLSGDMTFESITFQPDNINIFEYSQDTVMSGTVEGNVVVFGIAIGGVAETATIVYEGTVSEDGNHMSGTYSMSTGYTGTWGVRRK